MPGASNLLFFLVPLGRSFAVERDSICRFLLLDPVSYIAQPREPMQEYLKVDFRSYLFAVEYLQSAMS